MKTQKKNRLKGGMDPVKPFNPFSMKPPTPPTNTSAAVGEDIQKWFEDYKQEYETIYQKYFKKQTSAIPNTPKKLLENIKIDLLKLNPDLTDADAITQKLASEITAAVQSKKKADDEEIKKRPLDQEIIGKLNMQYLNLKKGVSQPEDVFEDFLKRTLTINFKISNNILQNRYVEAAKNYNKTEIVEEDIVVDFKQQKFEKLFRIVNCNPSCLGGEQEINILAAGLAIVQKKLVGVYKEMLNTPEPTEASAKISHQNTMTSAKKFIEEEGKNPLEFTEDEVKAFIAAMKTGELQKIYPSITSQCEKKVDSATETSKSEDSNKNKSESRTEKETNSQLFLDDTIRTSEENQDLIKNFDYSDLRDLLIYLLSKIEINKTDKSKTDDLNRRKEFLINAMRKKYFQDKQTELSNLIAVLNKTEKLTQNEDLVQRFGKRNFEEIKESMTEKGFLDDLQKIYNSAADDMKKTEAKNKEKELETKKIKAAEDDRIRRSENKKEYIKGFIERNGEPGKDFIDKVLAKGISATKDFDFEGEFPSENKSEFWEKMLNLKWKPTSTAAVTPKAVKETFRVKFDKIPNQWELELNKELNNFKLNEDGSFINADGIIVDVLGNPIKLDGGYRKSKKRGRHSSKNRNRRSKHLRRMIIK